MIDTPSEIDPATAFLERLNIAARPYRDRLETRLPLLDPHLTRAAYRRTLERYFGFFAPLEAAWESSCMPALRGDMARRRKTPWIIQDLFALDATPQALASLPLCRELPSLNNYARLLGSLYAVEGAATDGPEVFRSVRHALGEYADRACRFLCGYGAHAELMWEVLLENIRLASDQPEQQETIVAGACETFDRFERWMTAGKHG